MWVRRISVKGRSLYEFGRGIFGGMDAMLAFLVVGCGDEVDLAD
jgi:hypothetical protein